MNNAQMKNRAMCQLIAPALLAGCGASPTRQQIGTASGAVVGGVVGAALTGVAAGGLLGTEVARAPDGGRTVRR